MGNDDSERYRDSEHRQQINNEQDKQPLDSSDYLYKPQPFDETLSAQDKKVFALEELPKPDGQDTKSLMPVAQDNVKNRQEPKYELKPASAYELREREYRQRLELENQIYKQKLELREQEYKQTKELREQEHKQALESREQEHKHRLAEKELREQEHKQALESHEQGHNQELTRDSLKAAEVQNNHKRRLENIYITTYICGSGVTFIGGFILFFYGFTFGAFMIGVALAAIFGVRLVADVFKMFYGNGNKGDSDGRTDDRDSTDIE